MNRPNFCAGHRAVHFVALVDERRNVTRAFSGWLSYNEARARLRSIRRRYPAAVVVREILLRDVLT